VAGAAGWAEVAAVGDVEEGEGTLLQRYLTQAALISPTDVETGTAAEGTGTGGVTLLTAHMAKGLEWSVVALAGLEEGLFPLGRAAGEPGGLDEERRLCYVGLTRAREKLYLSWARTRYRYGRLELSQPSRFLDAVPPQVVDERSTTPAWDRGAARGRARGGVTRRAALEAADFPEEESQDAPRYATGERVRHRKFGGGVVRAVSGMGRDLKVTVEFDDTDVGTKQLLVAYAGLEREWESA
jgi:ATP-dependent DNA helicase UvrD/PcrA